MDGFEARVARRSIDAKDNLKALFKASKASSTTNLAAEDPIVSHFIRLKADIRTLLNYYAEEILYDSGNGNRNSEAQKLDSWLINFEKQYNFDNDGADEGVVTSTSHLFELSEHKDRAILKLLGGLRGLIPHDHQQLEQNLPAQISACSKDLSNVFHFVKTAKGLIKRCASIEVHMARESGVDLIGVKDRIISDLRKESASKDEKLMDLKAIIVAGDSDSSRFHALSRQQERINSLESQLISTTTAKEDAESYLRIVEQSKAVAQDQTALLHSQLKNLRANYDKDVSKLRPLFEEQVRLSQVDLNDVQILRNDTTLHTARLQSVERQLGEVKRQLHSSRQSEKVAHAEAAEARAAFLELQRQNSKLVRMQTVVVAAKLKFQENARNFENSLVDKDRQLKEALFESLESRRVAESFELLVEGLRQEVQEKQGVCDSMRNQLMLWKAEAASEHIATKVMRQDLNNILETDSASFRADYIRITDELASARETSERLNKQLGTAMHRIYELQGQLLSDKAIVNVEVEVEEN